MQTDEPETLLWNDRPSRAIEDEIANDPMERDRPSGRRTAIAPGRLHDLDLTTPGQVGGFPLLTIPEPKPGRRELITVSTEIFRGFLYAMANGTMNRNHDQAIRESVRLARLLITETDDRPKAKPENR